MDWAYESQEQRSQGRVKSGLRRGSLRSGQLLRPLHTQEAVPGPGKSVCGSQGGACERLECAEGCGGRADAGECVCVCCFMLVLRLPEFPAAPGLPRDTQAAVRAIFLCFCPQDLCEEPTRLIDP